ncbi:MAG: acyl-ACP--UDP-N-acetylglucosamine O-acyltransferase, partial [Elusimicrobiota bacterium]
MSNIHPTAIIDPSARLGADISIGPYCVIGRDVEIGSGAKVGAHTVIENATIGANLKVIAGAFIGTPPQDLKYKDEPTRVQIGDNCTVRECVTLNGGTTTDGGDGVTRIGNNCLFMAYSHVAHDCVVADNVIMTNCVALAGHVKLGEGAIIGGLSAVHQFVRIGEGAMIGGVSGVERDVPPYCLAQGNRCELIGLNLIGLKRKKADRATIAAVRNAFETLFNSNRPL